MQNNSNITVIIPIYSLDDKTKSLFANAIKSVEEQIVLPNEVMIVVPADSNDLDYIKSYDYGKLKDIITIQSNNGETDFCSQINLGIKNAKSDWISILEQDDELAKIWLKNVVEYQNAYPEVEMFMPIIVDVDPNNSFIGTTNEACLANGFSDALGYLDNGSLLAYQNFSIDGIVMKKSLIDEYGGFKKNIKLTFAYEFLLRMTFKDVKIMVIPRFGYKHVNQREGSLFQQYRDNMNPNEANWWLTQAKKEYYFPNDREIIYSDMQPISA